jgi:glycosyltransferase involved in cell wall biosynthesis
MTSISVVIPLYNKAAYIGRALDSVLSQTYAPDEILVIDDGSTDGGAEIVKQYEDPRIQLITQSNRGVSGARNRGIEGATCPMVAFLDADDEWFPTFLERTSAMMVSHPEVGTVFSNMRPSDTTQPWLLDRPRGLIDDYFAFFVCNEGKGIWSSAVLVRRDLLLGIHGFPEGVSHGEDLDTWARLAWQAPVAYVPEVLAVYHVSCIARAMNAPGRVIASGFAHCLYSCRKHLRLDQVPASSRRSTVRYAHMLAILYARELKDAGHSVQAFRILLEDLFQGMPLPMLPKFMKAAIRSACPSRLLAFRRKVRERMNLA